MQKILRLPAVIELSKKSRSAIYRDIKNGSFPAPVKIGERSTAWFEDDLKAWLAELPKQTPSNHTEARAAHSGKAGAK